MRPRAGCWRIRARGSRCTELSSRGTRATCAPPRSRACTRAARLRPSAAARPARLRDPPHRPDERRSSWLKGQIKFKGDTGDFGDDVSTNRAPLQKFHLGRLLAASPAPVHLSRPRCARRSLAFELGDPVELSVDAASNRPNGLGLHFNRGSRARAYRLRFGDNPPDEVADGAAYAGCRGDCKGALRLPRRTRPGDKLKVAIYELEEEKVVERLAAAKERGVRLRLLYRTTGRDQPQLRWLLHLPWATSKPVRGAEHQPQQFVVAPRGPLRVWSSRRTSPKPASSCRRTPASFRELAQPSTLLRGALPRSRKDDDARGGRGASALQPARRSPCLLRAFGTEILEQACRMIAEAARRSSSTARSVSTGDGCVGTRTTRPWSSTGSSTCQPQALHRGDRRSGTRGTRPRMAPRVRRGLWDARAYGTAGSTSSRSSRPLVGEAAGADRVGQLQRRVGVDDELALRKATGGSRQSCRLRMFDHSSSGTTSSARKGRQRALPGRDGSWAEDYLDPERPKFLEQVRFAQV